MSINKIKIKLERFLISFIDHKIKLNGRKACFTFDDVPKSAIDFVLNEIAYVPCTFFVSGDLCNTHENGIEICTDHDLNKVDWTFHELASHSYSHLNFQQNKQSTLIKDLLKNKNFLNKFSNQESLGFAFPKGRYDYRGYKSLVRTKTKYARTTQSGVNINNVNKYSIKAIPLYEKTYNINHIKKIIDSTKDFKNLLIVFYTHDISVNFGQFGCSKSYLNSVLKLTKKMNFELTTLSDAIK